MLRDGWNVAALFWYVWIKNGAKFDKARPHFQVISKWCVSQEHSHIYIYIYVELLRIAYNVGVSQCLPVIWWLVFVAKSWHFQRWVNSMTSRGQGVNLRADRPDKVGCPGCPADGCETYGVLEKVKHPDKSHDSPKRGQARKTTTVTTWFTTISRPW